MKRASCIFWLLLINFFSAASSYDVFEENGKVGLKNDNGKVLIPARYDALGWSDGKFTVLNNVVGFKEGARWGLITLDNRIITQASYDDVFPADARLIIARKKSNLSLRLVAGCLDTSGKEIIPFQYDGISVSNLRAVVYTKIGNQFRYGLVDLENKTLIPQQHKRIYPIGTLRYAVQNFDQKIALFTENGKQITSFTIDSLSAFKKNYAIIYQNKQQGVVDRDGVIKIQPQYRDIRMDEDGSVFSRLLDEWYFLDGQNKLFQKKLADSVRAIASNLLYIRTAGTVHLEDYTLKPLNAASYSTLQNFKNKKGIYSVNGKYGIARPDGTIVLPATFDDLYADRQFFIANMKLSGKNNWVVLDSLGKTLSPKSYDHIYPFTGNIFPVAARNFWGALDANGTQIIGCSYDSIVQHLNDFVVVKFKGQYGIINLKEAWIVTPRNNKLMLLTDDRFLEKGPKTTYLKSFDGTTIYFTDNKLEVSPMHIIEYIPSGSIWEVDLNGVIVSRKLQPDGMVEKIYPETEGLRGIKKNGQYGFVDSQGRLRIANRYDGIQPFKETLAAIKIRGKWGFLNHEDKIAIQPVYDEVTPFSNGFSIVKQKGMEGLIDKTGKLLLPTRYESIKPLANGNVLIKQEGLLGLSNRDGRILINPKYNVLQDLNNNYVVVGRDGKYGVVTIQGISTIPLIYDHIDYDPHNKYFLALKKSAWLKAL